MAESQTLDSMLMCTQAASNNGQAEKKAKPVDEQALKCPRCDSPNTKFCYYNNYSLTQPRYFCKSCRRYWTKGGTLRNVPVGGGCRKNKRSSSSSSSSFPKRSSPSDYHLIPTTNTTTTTSYDHPALAPHHGGHATSTIIPLYDGNSHFDLFGGGTSFLDTLRGGGGGALVESNHHHLLYYGGGVNVGHHDDRVDLTGMHYDDHHQNNINIIMSSNPSSAASTPRMKQEVPENRMLWGFPWQLNAEGIQGNHYINNTNNGGNHHEMAASLKDNWNSTAFVGSSWNNLLHSPLM